MALLAAGSLASACGTDSCELLCDNTSNRLGECLQDWPATWEDLDAESRIAWTRACKEEWSDERAALEPRELEDALDQCSEAQEALAAMRRDGTVCDELRALYLD